MKHTLLSVCLALGLFLMPGFGFNAFSGSAITLNTAAEQNKKIAANNAEEAKQPVAAYAEASSQAAPQHQIIWNKPHPVKQARN